MSLISHPRVSLSVGLFLHTIHPMSDRQPTSSMSTTKNPVSILNITFPKKERKFLQSLGGFLKPDGKKSADGKCLTGKMIFLSNEMAEKALSRNDLPDGVVMKRCGWRPKRDEEATDRLKVTGIPIESDMSDVAALFPAATSITIRDLRRTDFLVGSVHQYRKKIGREAIVHFESVEQCQESFRKAGEAQISGKKSKLHSIVDRKRNSKRLSVGNNGKLYGGNDCINLMCRIKWHVFI